MAHASPFMPTREQARIVEEPAPRILIEANAGVGKTTVLCMRVLRMIDEGADASRILLLAYSAPGKEAIRRTLTKHGALAPIRKKFCGGTFDDFCADQLARFENLKVQRFDRPEQVRPFVLKAIEQARADADARYPGEFGLRGTGEMSVEMLLQEFERYKGTMVKERLLGPTRVTPTLAAEANCDFTTLAIFQAYERARLAFVGGDGQQVRFRYVGDATYDLACMLVSDDPVFTYENHPLRMAPLQAIVVDEFHDMNWAMATVLKKLLEMHPEAGFAGVGDIDQVIHAASGAESYFLRSGFEVEFGAVRRMTLTVTQRFGEAIARPLAVFARKHYAWNPSRGSDLHVIALDGAKAQTEHIKQVLDERARARPARNNSEVAVLLRHPNAALDLEFHLLSLGISYETVGFTAYMSRPEVLFVRMILAVAIGYNDAFTDESFMAAKRATWEFIGGYLPNDGLRDAKSAEKINAMTFDGFRSRAIPEFLKWTDRKQGAQRAQAAMTLATSDQIGQLAPALETLDIRELAKHVFVNAEAVEDTEDSMHAIARMASSNNFGSILELLRVIRLQEDNMRSWSSKERIVLSTIDRAKGLEFEHVVIPGLDEGEFDGQSEDERNLFYVAVSRARHVVQLIHRPGRASAYLQVCATQTAS